MFDRRALLIRRTWRELCHAVLDLVCPPHCPGCGRDTVTTAPLCDDCAATLECRAGPRCDRCGEPLVATGVRCAADHRSLTGLELLRSPFRYAGTGGGLVRRMKFQRDFAAANYLARHMATSLRGWARGPGRRGRVVSVPLHPRKLRARGLDQAAYLAEFVAAELGLAFVPNALRRRVDTLPQGDPRVTSRETNVERAFALSRGGAVRGRPVVLVDDVITSGATSRACARLLRGAGASTVVLATAARA